MADSEAAKPVTRKPVWERLGQGRMEFELDDLARAGVVPKIDSDALEKNGQLVLTFAWVLTPETTVELKAVYPDDFPFIRPHVTLLSGLEPWPTQHINPIDGNVCLLGRDSSQWAPSWTLKRLLTEQLAKALLGGGDEDPQAEPAEVWWNCLTVPGSFVLIDSAWDMPAERGSLILRYAHGPRGVSKPRAPVLHAVVSEVRDADDKVLHRFEGAVPPEIIAADIKPWKVPWRKLTAAILPANTEDKRSAQFQEFLKSGCSEMRVVGHDGTAAALLALVYPSEIARNRQGFGWTLLQISGHPSSFQKGRHDARKQKRMQAAHTIAVFRAGPSDVGERVPAVSSLRTKRVLVVGTGALGAPLSLELARNQCGTLHVMDFDVVEPGNTVRWPLGATAWGRPKVVAVADFVRREFPATQIVTHVHSVGSGSTDAVLNEILANVDVVVDASASHGVTNVMAARCRERGLPLISLFATPSVEGGAVVRHNSDGGCPTCLEYAWYRGDIVPPPGRGRDDTLIQAPGCADRTFTGAAYDLQELSLQAVRLLIETLSVAGGGDALIQTLSFGDGAGARLPHWRVDPLPKHRECRCRPDA